MSRLSGRIFRNVQRAAISENTVKLLAKLNIYHNIELRLTTEFGKLFYGSVDTLQQLTDYCEYLEKRRRHFAASCQHFYSN